MIGNANKNEVTNNRSLSLAQRKISSSRVSWMINKRTTTSLKLIHLLPTSKWKKYKQTNSTIDNPTITKHPE